MNFSNSTSTVPKIIQMQTHSVEFTEFLYHMRIISQVVRNFIPTQAIGQESYSYEF